MMLGIDVGTGKVAAAIVDRDGRALAVVSETHGASISAPPGRAEQDSVRLMEAAWSAVQQLPPDLRREVRAVGVTGQMHGVVVADACGEPLTPVVTWQDQRCLEDPGFLPALNRAAGHNLHTGYGAATLAWMRRNDCLPRGAAWAASVPELVVARLCGAARAATDPTMAASFGLFDLRALQWDRAAFQAAGVSAELLSEVRPCGSAAGVVSPAMAGRLGIPAGIPVAVAIGDNQASLLATLREPESEIALTLGTGGQVSVVVSAAEAAPLIGAGGAWECRPYPGGRMIVVGAALCGGGAWLWLAESVAGLIRDAGLPPPPLADIYRRLDELGLAAAGSLVVTPRFLGERHDSSLRGAIEGIDLKNFTLGELARGLARGVAANLRGLLPPAALEGRRRVVGSGNGLRRSRLQQAMTGEVFGLPLVLAEGREEAACGAALNARHLIAE